MTGPPLTLESIQFIGAENYTRAQRTSVDLIVLHSMESPEKPGTARNVAWWFAGAHGSPVPQASAHYVIDPEEVLRCVRDEDVAWAAPGANRRGLHIELAGRAAQSHAEWGDEDSMAILMHAIDLCVLLCAKWKIPAVGVLPEEMAEDQGRGITTHAMVTQAFPDINSHWDPGPNFPLGWVIGRVAAILLSVESV